MESSSEEEFSVLAYLAELLQEKEERKKIKGKRRILSRKDGTANFTMSLLGLPHELMLHVFTFLDFRDMLSCSSVCKLFYKLSKDELFWKMQCRICWLEERCPDDTTWREHFMDWYEDFGRYVDIYRRVRKAWNQLENFSRENCPNMYWSLQEGVSEDYLDFVEDKIQFELPDALRCVYRIHDGQDFDKDQGAPPGLFGSIETGTTQVYDQFRDEKMIALDELEMRITSKTFNIAAMGLMALTSSYSGTNRYLCVSNKLGFEVGKLYRIDRFHNYQPAILSERNSFVIGNSYLDWFTKYAQDVTNKTFPVVKWRSKLYIYDYYQEPGWIAVTGHVRVSVGTAFIHEMSSVEPPKFMFAYRVTMSMDSNVSPRHTCQLDTCCWASKDGFGKTEIVNESGVKGEHPILRPGEEYSYVSSIIFKNTYGEMSGTYIFQNLLTGQPLEVAVPLFRMRCPEILTAAERKQKLVDRFGSAE